MADSADFALSPVTGSDGSVLRYKLHPVVVFSILDHHKRRASEQSFVIGTLLGYRSGNEVIVTSCFPLPHKESMGAVTFDPADHQQQLRWHQAVSPRASPLGLYFSNPKLSMLTVQIADMFEKTLAIPAPLILSLDASLSSNRLNVKGHFVKTLKVAGKDALVRFDPAALLITAAEAEKVAVDAIISSETAPDDTRFDAPANFLTKYENLQRSLHRLISLITPVQDFAQSAADGKVEPSPEVARRIAAAVAAVPRLNPEDFRALFETGAQDLDVVQYLARLTQTQVEIADRITTQL